MSRVSLVGFGPGSEGMLTCAAHRELQQADVIIGAQRLLDVLPEGSAAERVAAVRDEEIVTFLQEARGWQKACVVLSGDVGIFSGAKRLQARLKAYEVVVIPGISSAQYFAAKLQRPWQDWRFASAHGIKCDIAKMVEVGSPLFLVTGGSNTVASLCATLCEAGHDDAQVSVGERLSYAAERVVQGRAEDFCTVEFDSLSVMLVEVATPPKEARWPWVTPGIPDDSFVRGQVPMTKQEVRVVALAKLRIAARDTVYDIGAGTGSVAVEAALLACSGQVFAIERNEEACTLIRENCKRFGVSNVKVLEGYAPEALRGLPVPDAVFIGGSGKALSEILTHIHRINPQVRLCIPCVTLETLSETLELLTDGRFSHFETTQVAVSRAEAAGAYHLMRAQNPVFIVSAQGVNHEA